MAVNIGIIGGTAGMGKWFAEFLARAGFCIRVTGLNREVPLEELARSSSIIIVSVPISVTGEVIAEVGPQVARGGLLMDLTSLKAEPIRAMLEATGAEVLGCHPLFGPEIESPAGQNIVLCPGRGTRWLPFWRDLFAKNGLRVTEMEAKGHDEMMALVQGVNHVNTLIMGAIMAKEGVTLDDITGLTTPLFRDKLSIIRRFFDNNPALYADILTNNPHLNCLLEVYEETLRDIRELIHDKGPGDLALLISRNGDFLAGREGRE